MHRVSREWSFILIYAVSLVLAMGCAKKVNTTEQAAQQPQSETPAPPPIAQPKAQPEAPVPHPKAVPPTAKLDDVFFKFDKALLSPDSLRILNEDARWIKDHPGTRITVEGHCDERGTAEYNLALGDRRARAIKRYLESVGLGPERIKTISYGQERPFCREHTERCWQENRRGHLVKMGSGD